MKMDFSLLDMADIAAADELLRLAFAKTDSYLQQLKLNLSIQPNCYFALWDGALLVGMVGVCDFGNYCHVGLMAVHPQRQGRGIGKKLLEATMDWAARRGCPTVTLYSTDAGLPLYRSMGFSQKKSSFFCTGKGRRLGGEMALPLDASHLDEIAALDHSISGGSRRALFAALLAEGLSPAFYVPGQGYLFVRQGVIGPWAACTDAAAELLLRTALHSAPGEELKLTMAEENEPTKNLVLSYDFRLERPFAYFERGAAFPQQRHLLRAIASYSLG
jgi:GNAT superfamily N-acetyltransferase